jgi:hypothetical protein
MVSYDLDTYRDISFSGFDYKLPSVIVDAIQRLSSELGMNSVILLVKSNYYTWFMPFLKEGVHYVSVNEDLSNLTAEHYQSLRLDYQLLNLNILH